MLLVQARDTNVSDILTASPPGSRLGSFKSAGAGSPFFPGGRQTLELRASSGGWLAPGRGSELPAVAWPAAAQLAEGQLSESTALPLGGNSSVSGPPGASDSEEDPHSSPDTLLSAFSVPTELSLKAASVCSASGFPAPGGHSPPQAPLEAAKCGDQPSPQLRCSSLTLAMRGGDAATASAFQSAAATAERALRSGTGAALCSASDPAPSAAGPPLRAAPATTVAAATQRRASKSLLSSNLSAARGARSPISAVAPAPGRMYFPAAEVYTLSASEAAAIAAAQQHAHPTVRGRAPPPAFASPAATEQPAPAGAGPTAPAAGHSQASVAPKVRAAQPHDMLLVFLYYGLSVCSAN